MQNRTSLRERLASPAGRTTLVFALILLGLLIYGLFFQEKGVVETVFNDEFFGVSTQKDALFIRYEDVESAELIDAESFDVGELLSGHAGKRYLQGTWRNETLGDYTLSVNTRSAAWILLHYDGKTLVFSGNKTAQTEQYYETLTGYLGATG